MGRITRRGALALGATSPLIGACGLRKSANDQRIAVIGAGIMGAAIAYFLSMAGAKVTVLERHDIATRASRGTFAWLNATWAKQPRHYHRLNQLGLAGWKSLERDLAIPIKWGGSIEWFAEAERQKRLVAQIQEQIEWGEPARMINSGEFATLEPHVDFGDTPTAAYSPNDGALDPVLATSTLLAAAERLGAKVVTQCDVRSIRSAGGASVLDTTQGEFECDRFVLATGADPDAMKALAGVDLPQRSTPGVIIVTKPMPLILNRILVAPGIHIHQRLDGRLVLGEQDGAPDNEAHAQRLAQRPNRFPSQELAAQHAARMFEIARKFLPPVSEAEVADVFIGWRPLPLDGHPVIGASPANPNAYVAISHSGVSLAPILGKLAASEVLDEAPSEWLAPYRPDRSFEEIKRY